MQVGTIYKHENGMILKLETFRGLQNLNTFIELNEDHTEKTYKIVTEMRAIRMVSGFERLTQIE